MEKEIVEVLKYIRDNISAETFDAFYVNNRVENASGLLKEDLKSITEMETHHFPEMAIQIDKTSCLQIGNYLYTLNKYQFCIIPHGEQHCIRYIRSASHTASMLWISITGDIIRAGYTMYSKTKRSKIYGADLQLPGGFLINSILEEQRMGRAGSQEAVLSYIKTFLSLLLQKLTFEADAGGHGWAENVVNELQEYIREHLLEPIRLQDLSNHVSLTPSYVCKLFKQVTGDTITYYTHKLKIDKAIEYLSESNMSLSEIAEVLGFYDQFHFSKVFKVHVGVPPSKYRSGLTAKGAMFPISSRRRKQSSNHHTEKE